MSVPVMAQFAYALAASHHVPDVSECAKAVLDSADGGLIDMEIQSALSPMGQDVSSVDGVLGLLLATVNPPVLKQTVAVACPSTGF